MPPHHAQQRGEQLWIIEGADLQLGLAIDQAALRRLGDHQLGEDNLQSFCLAVEGVSHFLFVMHRARRDQPTSALELELQSEVDKYVAALMLARRGEGLPSESLRGRLFRGDRLIEGLPVEEQQRYHRANRLADRFARRLERHYVRRYNLPAMLRELRRFYRMPCWAKQAHIACH